MSMLFQDIDVYDDDTPTDSVAGGPLCCTLYPTSSLASMWIQLHGELTVDFQWE